MMKWTTSNFITAVLAVSSSIATVNGKPDSLSADKATTTTATKATASTTVYVPPELVEVDTTTTTTTSSRAAQWGTVATITASPTSSPTKRIPDQDDILPLCQSSLSSALTFDTDDSSALDKHEFSEFIEKSTGSSTVILSQASDTLYKELRKACVTVFKMQPLCYDETTDVTDATEVVEETTEETTEEATEDDASVSNSTMVVFDDASNNDSTESAEVQEEEDVTTAEIIDPASVDWAAIAAFAAESSATSTSEVAVTPDEEEESTITNTASEINAADTSFVQSNTINEQQQPSAGSLNKIPSGGWIGIGLGVFLLAFLIAAVIVARTRRRRRRLNDSGDRQANNNNNDDDNSIWSDEENNNMMQGAGGSALSSVSAIGMASTVVTRLTTGDTEVTLMKKQPWTEREPVV